MNQFSKKIEAYLFTFHGHSRSRLYGHPAVGRRQALVQVDNELDMLEELSQLPTTLEIRLKIALRMGVRQSLSNLALGPMDLRETNLPTGT